VPSPLIRIELSLRQSSASCRVVTTKGAFVVTHFGNGCWKISRFVITRPPPSAFTCMSSPSSLGTSPSHRSARCRAHSQLPAVPHQRETMSQPTYTKPSVHCGFLYPHQPENQHRFAFRFPGGKKAATDSEPRGSESVAGSASHLRQRTLLASCTVPDSEFGSYQLISERHRPAFATCCGSPRQRTEGSTDSVGNC